MQEMHTENTERQGICVDPTAGIFFVYSNIAGKGFLSHVRKKIVGEDRETRCENKSCFHLTGASQLSGQPGIECIHLRHASQSKPYTATTPPSQVKLQEMLERKWISVKKKDDMTSFLQEASAAGTDPIVPLTPNAAYSQKYYHFSVYAPDNWCRLGRVRVTYDSQHHFLFVHVHQVLIEVRTAYTD